jgi:hypothetical protein
MHKAAERQIADAGHRGEKDRVAQLVPADGNGHSAVI